VSIAIFAKDLPLQFDYAEPQTELERLFGGRFHINAVGKIEAGDSDRFREFLAQTKPPPRLTVYIDSTGGDVESAIEMGRIIRDHWFSTDIGTYLLDLENPNPHFVRRTLIPGKCFSAATLAYLGGRLRYLSKGSKFGVHQFSFRNPSPENVSHSQRLSAKIARFVEDMGISAHFLELSSETPGTDLTLLEEQHLKELKVITGGATEVTWTVHARNRQMYVRGERDTLYGHQKVMLGYVKGGGFHFWAVIEAQGREAELSGFGIVEIVANDENDRIDVSQRCMRIPMGVYVNVFVSISQEEAKLLAYSDGFGVQIRASNEAPVFFGIAPMPTINGSDQLQTFYHTLCDQ
jgi:hypothetical protein